jgi:hypothetical protein
MSATFSFDVSNFERDDQTKEIDRNATIAKFESQLDSWLELQAANDERIDEVLNQLADANHDKGYTVPVWRGLAMKEIETSADTIQEIERRVVERMRSNPRFRISRGKGGCTIRNESELSHYLETGEDLPKTEKASKTAEAV